MCTALLIQNDCETLKKLILKYQDSIFNMEIIPYLALFCRSFQEYCDIELISKDVDSEIYDIRNSIKIYGARYGKSKKQFLESDERQDEEFRNMLCFDFTKNFNMHFNLGVYFTEDKKIVGNTQLIANTLNMHGLSEKERQEKSYTLGYHLASIIGSVSRGVSDTLATPNIILRGNLPKFYYDDFNTNRNDFLSPVYEKDINLFMLHLLSNMNFIKYILEPLFLNKNAWIFRIKFITIHYTYQGLKKLKAHIENSNADMKDLVEFVGSILENEKILFTSKFRNCMMHYDLGNGGNFVIKEENFDEKKMFYGLIEECFDGASYEVYTDRINCLWEKIENFLTQQFNLDVVSLKEF